MTKFLTLDGLKHYDGKIKAIIPSKSEFEQLKNTVANGMSWRNPVENLEALKAIKTPKEGWTVSLSDTNQIYRFDAQDKTETEQSPNIIKPTDKTAGAWILLGTAVYTKATKQQDGLMGTDHVTALEKATQDIATINNKFEGANAKSANKLTTAHKISITGAVTAEGVAFDGTQDIALNVTNVNIGEHNQASNTITALTGYQKPGSATAITATDSLNTAIGKLEKGLDNKLNTSDVQTITNGEIDALFQ